MNFLSASPDSLFRLQIVSFILVILGFTFLEFSFWYAFTSVICFYLYSIVGLSITLHRFYSHKSFKLNSVVKWIFTGIAVLAGRGSPLGWVYVHRIHHATSDTDKDPHSPHFDTFKFIGFRPVLDKTKQINYFIVKELLTPAHKNIDKYYVAIILAFIFLLACIDINLIVYAWALPVLAVSISQIAFNYFCHKHGYRNFETKDKSTNNKYMWPFILGDAWHNNHHANAEQICTTIKPAEFDPAAHLISLLRTDKHL